MHKHFYLGNPRHIPSICKHKVFRKDILVIYLVHDKPPKDVNGYGFPDAAPGATDDSDNPPPALLRRRLRRRLAAASAAASSPQVQLLWKLIFPACSRWPAAVRGRPPPAASRPPAIPPTRCWQQPFSDGSTSWRRCARGSCPLPRPRGTTSEPVGSSVASHDSDS